PPLLCLHGFPQTHHMWFKVAPFLAERFTVVATDLRGYGESSKPEDDGTHELYSKRCMANDQVEVMKQLGYDKFYLLSHDRGARVATRLALDHPDAVIKLVVLDIVPTCLMYDTGNSLWATYHWHWFFLVQPRPISEGFMNGSPDILKAFLPRLAITSPTAHASYCKNLDDPACIHAMCEDYRASSPGGGSVPQGPDYVLDKSDLENVEGGRRVKCDLMILWAKRSAIAVFWDAKKEWRKFCTGEVVGREVDCGHFIPE
ncbi:hypothetical protein PILCRDRAFT_41520, partial [Piloderma croceum F 1598]